MGTDPNKRCGDPDTSKPGHPSKAWPADLWTLDGANEITLNDLTSFLGPVKRFGTSSGDANYDQRWDVLPGSGMFTTTINASDLTTLITLKPPMFDGQSLLGGGTCS